MVVSEKLYTAEEFWETARLPENEGWRLELEDGVIIEIAGSNPINTVTAMRISHFFNAFAIPRDLGYVTGADGGFKLAPRRGCLPDVGFVARQRLPALPENFELAPDIAVEVVSPDEDVFKKVREYIDSGTRPVWTVYPEEQTVNVFRPAGDGELRVRTYEIGDTLDGGEVLPDFTLPVRDIFPE